MMLTFLSASHCYRAHQTHTLTRCLHATLCQLFLSPLSQRTGYDINKCTHVARSLQESHDSILPARRHVCILFFFFFFLCSSITTSKNLNSGKINITHNLFLHNLELSATCQCLFFSVQIELEFVQQFYAAMHLMWVFHTCYLQMKELSSNTQYNHSFVIIYTM